MIDFEEAPLSRGAFFCLFGDWSYRQTHEYLLNILQELADGASTCKHSIPCHRKYPARASSPIIYLY